MVFAGRSARQFATVHVTLFFPLGTSGSGWSTGRGPRPLARFRLRNWPWGGRDERDGGCARSGQQGGPDGLGVVRLGLSELGLRVGGWHEDEHDRAVQSREVTGLLHFASLPLGGWPTSGL